MKKWLILVAAFAVLGGIFFAVSSLTREKSLGLCEQFITYVRDGNADAAYGLFTSQAKSTTDPDTWREQVSSMRGAYYDPAAPGFTLKERVVTAKDDGGAELSATETYIIPSGQSRYRGTCYVDLTGGNQLIDGYISEASLDGADYKTE